MGFKVVTCRWTEKAEIVMGKPFLTLFSKIHRHNNEEKKHHWHLFWSHIVK